MANCPKCDAHLKLSDWRQNCPHCGANIVVYDIQERLMAQADAAEVEHYHFQKKIDRLKASFIGSKLAITRIITSLIPAGAVFLPLMKGTISEPFKPLDGGVSLLDVINNIDGLTGDGIPTMLSESNKAGIFFVASIALFVLSALALLLHFVLNTLSCSPKGKPRNMAMDVIILVTTFASAICFYMMPDNPFVKGTLGIGALLYILLQIVNVVIDYLTMKQGIPVNHKQCYVGGIPIEEYFEMQKRGMTTAEIREIQYERLQAMQDAADAAAAEKAREEAEKEKEKAEKAREEEVAR